MRPSALQVGDVGGQAEDGHDLAGHRDVEAVLARHAVGLAAQAVHDVAQLAVVHVYHALPRDLAHVDAQLVAVLDVVVQQRRQQVVGRADGVEVAGEVQVDVLHGDDLGVAAAGRAALDAEHGAEGRLAQRDDHVLALLRQASARPTVVVVLPSPAGVGLMAVTRMSLPCFDALWMRRWFTLAL